MISIINAPPYSIFPPIVADVITVSHGLIAFVVPWKANTTRSDILQYLPNNSASTRECREIVAWKRCLRYYKMRACNNKEETEIGMDGSIRVAYRILKLTERESPQIFTDPIIEESCWRILYRIDRRETHNFHYSYNVIRDNSYNFNTEYKKNSLPFRRLFESLGKPAFHIYKSLFAWFESNQIVVHKRVWTREEGRKLSSLIPATIVRRSRQFSETRFAPVSFHRQPRIHEGWPFAILPRKRENRTYDNRGRNL